MVILVFLRCDAIYGFVAFSDVSQRFQSAEWREACLVADGQWRRAELQCALCDAGFGLFVFFCHQLRITSEEREVEGDVVEDLEEAEHRQQKTEEVRRVFQCIILLLSNLVAVGVQVQRVEKDRDRGKVWLPDLREESPSARRQGDGEREEGPSRKFVHAMRTRVKRTRHAVVASSS